MDGDHVTGQASKPVVERLRMKSAQKVAAWQGYQDQNSIGSP